MTEPTTAEIRERHDTIDRYNGAEFSDYIFADEDRGILLDRLEAAEQEMKELRHAAVDNLKEMQDRMDFLKGNNESMGYLESVLIRAQTAEQTVKKMLEALEVRNIDLLLAAEGDDAVIATCEAITILSKRNVKTIKEISEAIESDRDGASMYCAIKAIIEGKS